MSDSHMNANEPSVIETVGTSSFSFVLFMVVLSMSVEVSTGYFENGMEGCSLGCFRQCVKDSSTTRRIGHRKNCVFCTREFAGT